MMTADRRTGVGAQQPSFGWLQPVARITAKNMKVAIRTRFKSGLPTAFHDQVRATPSMANVILGTSSPHFSPVFCEKPMPAELRQ